MARKNAVKDNLEQIQHQSYSELQELLSESQQHARRQRRLRRRQGR